MQKKNFKPKEDKAKHGLMIRAKISHFLAWECEGFTVEKERKEEENKKKEGRRKKEEGRMKKEEGEEENIGLEVLNSCLEICYSYLEVWNSCLEHLFCLELLDLLVRKPP